MCAAPRFPISDHCDGRRFFNPERHVNRSWFDVLRWKLTSRPAPWPASVALSSRPKPPAFVRDGTLRATWINHSTVLLETRWGNVLTDPVYGEKAGPWQRLGPKRAHAPGLPWEDLPPIDLVLLSHDHYDHCDLSTLGQLARRSLHTRAVTLLGNAPLLRRAGFGPERVTELDWWEAHELGESCYVRATPARHWSNRLSGGRNGRLWGGFYLHAGGRTVHYVGDSAYDPAMYRAVRQRCGSPDLALIPIGAYAPRWFMAEQHCNPAEAVRIHEDLGARMSLGIHWGTFQLTDEGRDDPPRELAAALEQAGLSAVAFRALAPGEPFTI